MSDLEAPIEVDPEDAGTDLSEERNVEAPEADVLEQRAPTRPDPSGIQPPPDPMDVEASEGDLLEQAQVAELDEDEQPL